MFGGLLRFISVFFGVGVLCVWEGESFGRRG